MPRWSRMGNRSRFWTTHVALISTILTLAFGTFALAQSGRAGDFRDAWGEHVGAGRLLTRPAPRPSADAVRRWNDVTLDANALDHTPVADGENRVFGEQLGPGRTSRAFAIVHIAMFDAVNAIVGGYRSYTGLQADGGVGFLQYSIDAAVATAAHDTLAAVYPSQALHFDELLAEDLSQIPDGRPKQRGIELGHRAAVAILEMRSGDGSDHAEPRIPDEFVPRTEPGFWRQDPISQIPIALGAYWGTVTPFVLQSVHQFPHTPPPALDSREYTEAFNEVKDLGGDGVVTPTTRTLDQTIAGIYWGYDGTPGLGTPPRLYNQIVRVIADRMRSSDVELARLLALINAAMADVGIACWEAKYRFQVWRPITGIREADTDDNPHTAPDPTFTPLGAPASNFDFPNFTPPFPAFESGHSAFGSAVFQMLRNFYRTDRIAFTFVSDEFNGITTDNTGAVRPRIPRRFRSLSAAEEENAQSRIYLGIHWAFDKTKGRVQGRQVANYVFEHAFVRQPGWSSHD